MKKRREIVCMALIAMLLMIQTLPALAVGEDYALSMEAQDSCHPGDTVTVSIKAAEAAESTNIGSFQFTLSYDTSKLTFVSLTAAAATSSGAIINGETISWSANSDQGLKLGNGTGIATATFTVNTGASGSAAIGFDTEKALECTAIDKHIGSASATGKTINITAAGYTVSGQVKSYNPNNPVTVKLMQSGVEKYSTTIAAASGSGQVTGDFSISAVADGTYDLVVTKPCHLTYTVKGVVVNGADVDLTAAASSKPYKLITMLVGDVNGDTIIDESDVSVVRYSTNINHSVTTADSPVCDVNGDLLIDESDVTVIRYSEHINKKLSDCTFNY